MKIAHRRTLWQHTLFSAIMCAGLIAIALVRRDIPTVIIAALIAVYVVGNAALHVRRDDFKKETMYEYVLLALAVFVVLASALTH